MLSMLFVTWCVNFNSLTLTWGFCLYYPLSNRFSQQKPLEKVNSVGAYKLFWEKQEASKKKSAGGVTIDKALIVY